MSVEELKKQLEKCSYCGLCKHNCPVFAVLLNESFSPRGKSILMKKDMLDEIFYVCALCKACENSCPAGIELPELIRRARTELVEKGVVPEANRKMIENIKKEGNPFGKLKKGKTPKELYCC
jgi:glycolate oxidase iron-sulfur subunit